MSEKTKQFRGINSLFDDIDEVLSINNENVPNEFKFVDINLIDPNPNQPRKTFIDESLQELAGSLREFGFINPITLQMLPNSNRYMIIAGERRYRAAKLLNLQSLPAYVKNYAIDDPNVMAVTLIENIQREDLNPLEHALSIKQLIKAFNYTHEEVASKIGKSRSYVSNALRILALPEPVIEDIRTGKITASHARTAASSENPIEFVRKIKDHGMTVRNSENLLRDVENPVLRDNRYPRTRVLNTEINFDLNDIERKLSTHLGLDVQIVDNRAFATISFRFDQVDDLEQMVLILTQGAGLDLLT